MARFSIRFTRESLDEIVDVDAAMRQRIADTARRTLEDQPLRAARNRKPLPRNLLTGFAYENDPLWELRVEDWRVYYDVDQQAAVVVIRAIRHKGWRTTEEVVQ